MAYEDGRTLADRNTLAAVYDRSPHTIRLRCTPVRYDDRTPLYDAEQVHAILAAIPARRRAA